MNCVVTRNNIPGLSRRLLATVQPSAAMPGVMESSMSCPYRHMPASRRRESRAARPAQRAESDARIALAMDVASATDEGSLLSLLEDSAFFSAGIEISKPSSPV